jgi:ribose transport system substrate-binding protein
MTIFIVSSLKIINQDYNKYSKDYLENYVLIKKESNNYFWNQIENGIINECDSNNVAIEVLDVSNTTLLTEKEILEMAIVSRPDGIIMSGYNSENMEGTLEKAKENNIPVVFINDDGINSLRSAYIGPNDYRIGQKAIQEVIKNLNQEAKILIVDEYNSQNRNLLIDGMISEINSNENIKLVMIATSENRFELENDLRKILANNSEINLVIGTNIYYGSAIAKVIVKMNRVGEIKIIAFDNSNETMNYIKKGIITATLFTDGYKIGIEAVDTLLKVNEDDFNLDVYYIPTTIINDNNIDIYLDSDPIE